MTEIWKDIRGFEGKYQISNLGRVRSLDRFEIVTNPRGKFKRFRKGKILSLNDNGHGYLTVKLGRKGGRHYVHRLVAEHFVDNPLNLPEINHIDNNTKNNVASNLEWTTRQDNILHMVKQNRQSKGSDRPKAKLKESDVVKIKEMLRQGMDITQIAERYKVHPTTIKDIRDNRTWKHVG